MDCQNDEQGNVMRPKDRKAAKEIDAGLRSFAKRVRRLPGIQHRANRSALLEQIMESIHRIEYVSAIRALEINPDRANPASQLFDPLKAAIWHQDHGNVEESFWLVFLFVHFGKHKTAGWRLARDIYGRLGNMPYWTWNAVSADPAGFRDWLAANQYALQNDGVPRHFGNHRKYQSLDARSATGTGAAFESYVRWVMSRGSHAALVAEAISGVTQREAFRRLYKSMEQVTSFGRTARFDYLTMLGKLGLAKIEPDSAYLQGATGPVSGARLLFGGRRNARLSRAQLDAFLLELDSKLEVGMQVLEDSLCNWQKSPRRFVAFRG
jgi:hypothetical protein